MIRKILVQDIVSKRSGKSGKDDRESSSASESRTTSARERDFLIERLTRKHTTEAPQKSAPKAAAKVSRPATRRKKGFKLNLGNKWVWISVPIVIIAVTLLVLQIFSGAIVTVTPKHMTVATSTMLLASNSTTTGGISYQIITLSAVDSQQVSSTGVVSAKPKKATGQIMVFNKFSTAPQTLIKNTRFETVEGLVYRLVNTVKVPGGTVSAPGSISVDVVADQTGSKYNIGLADFTIPGFKTDANRYAKIFGRSQSAMTGGADSSSIGINDSDRQSAQAQIEARLKDTLMKQAQAEKSADSVIFDDASKVSFQAMPDAAGSDPQHALVSERGTISSVVFDKKSIGKILLSDAIAKVGNNAQVHGIETLHFTPNVASTTLLWPIKPFTFNLSGSMDVIGIVDAAKLIQDIRGVSRTVLPDVISHYPTIDKVSVVLKPFWQNSFPMDVKKIKVEITN